MTSIGTHRVFGIVFAAFACVLVLPIDSASAQGFFETLFGSFRRPAPHATSFADPLVLFGNGTGRTSNDFAGGGVTLVSASRRLQAIDELSLIHI